MDTDAKIGDERRRMIRLSTNPAKIGIAYCTSSRTVTKRMQRRGSMLYLHEGLLKLKPTRRSLVIRHLGLRRSKHPAMAVIHSLRNISV